MNLYMHTLNGKPAYYEEGKQVCFAYHGIDILDLLVSDLKKLRQQQRRSREWRKKQGLTPDLPAMYGYLRVKT